MYGKYIQQSSRKSHKYGLKFIRLLMPFNAVQTIYIHAGNRVVNNLILCLQNVNVII